MESIERMINREAIFSDGTEFYLSPAEPVEYDKVKIRLRTAKNDVNRVVLMFPEQHIQMKIVKSDALFDYYEGEFWLENQPINYYFKIEKENEAVYFNQEGVVDQINPFYNHRIIPGYKTPDWAKGAVYYQIFVDRFANGNMGNNVENREYIYIGEPVNPVEDWYKYPESMGVREFYGGDLKGIMSKLDYLQELGVEVLYLNPIFVSPSNHKYDTQDYDYIDPHFTVIEEDGGEVLAEGDCDNSHATKYKKRVTDKKNLEASNAFFAAFVEEVHKRGMKVILDGVFNHCGSFNKWLDRERLYEDSFSYEKGAFVDKDSPYRSFFKFREDEWPYNTKYDGWWGHDTLPKLNYEESDKLFRFIMRIAKKWIAPPFKVDGWRLDVAADLGNSEEFNHKFWKEFRRVVKEQNPNAIILAEHYGDASPWLSGGEWDSVMNYDAFMEPITWFLTGMEKHSDAYRGDLLGNDEEFWTSMRRYSTRFICQSAQVAMNELSNHDHSRFLTRTNHTVGRITYMSQDAANQNVNRARMMAGVFFQMTWIGAPTIYYGDEAGVCGWTDPDNRRTYPWGREDKEMIECHRELIRIHKDYRALRVGSTLRLYSERNLICYGRFDDTDSIFVLIYIGNEEKDIEIPVWRMGLGGRTVMVKLAESTREGFSLSTEIKRSENGMFHVHVKPDSALMWKNLYSKS